jgi:hypothetical protein
VLLPQRDGTPLPATAGKFRMQAGGLADVGESMRHNACGAAGLLSRMLCVTGSTPSAFDNAVAAEVTAGKAMKLTVALLRPSTT